MAVASVSVILTVVVLKLHHCSPNQQRIPGWVRHLILGHLAKIVRCGCVTLPCRPQDCFRKARTKENSTEMRVLQTKLLREMESLTSKASTCINRINDRNARNRVINKTINSSSNELTGSRANLELRDLSVSDRSSTVEEDISANIKRDASATALEEIHRCLKVLVMRSDAEDAETEVVDEWKQVALVVDRLFFWLFMLITIVSSIIILVIVPSFKYISDEGV